MSPRIAGLRIKSALSPITTGAGSSNTLRVVWGSSPNDVWAAGEFNLIHWTGSSWTRVATGTDLYAYALWSSGPNDVWAAGVNSMAHWNGTAWTSVASASSYSVLSMWGSSSGDIWAVGVHGNIQRRRL